MNHLTDPRDCNRVLAGHLLARATYHVHMTSTATMLSYRCLEKSVSKTVSVCRLYVVCSKILRNLSTAEIIIACQHSDVVPLCEGPWVRPVLALM